MNCYKIKDLIDEIEYYRENDQPLDTMTDMLVNYYIKTYMFVNNQMVKKISEYEEKQKSTLKSLNK